MTECKGIPKRTSIHTRYSKVNISDLGKPATSDTSLSAFVENLPSILAAEDFKNLIDECLTARRNNKGLLIGLGGHVIKTGIAPYLIALMDAGFVSGLALNGAAMIHDFELALNGATSEDVEEGLGKGEFGFSEETGRILNTIINDGVAQGKSIGESVCEAFQDNRFPHATVSLIAQAGRLSIPVTVHVALGTDIIHMHPECSGAATGEGTFRDFKRFCGLFQQHLEGGGYINCGSAVLLPEVFLKALSLARNLNPDFHDFFSANFDFIRQYRPMQSIITRPKLLGARSYAFTGHHELMLPLLCSVLLERWENDSSS